MNKRGQTLIFFVLFIPIFVILLTLVIDVSYVIKNKIKIEGVTEYIFSEIINSTEDEAITITKNIFKENKIDLDDLKIKIEENKVQINVKSHVKSIFGNIIGIKQYKIELSLTATIDNGKIRIEKG